MNKGVNILKWLASNWERFFFSIIGIVLIGYSLFFISIDHVANAGVVFGLGFLSFIYANVARFKKFKGLGFEAELWEDTKKEAEDLIQRLRNVVGIYSREAILSRMSKGRIADGNNWQDNWKLYDDLVTQHTELGQKIDFSDVKRELDNHFLGDMIRPLYVELHRIVFKAQDDVNKKISNEFGPVIKDNAGYIARLNQKREIIWEIKDFYPAIISGENLAQHVLEYWNKAKEKLKRNFDMEISAPQTTLDRLKKITEIADNRPVSVTPELIDWANQQPDYAG